LSDGFKKAERVVGVCLNRLIKMKRERRVRHGGGALARWR
jgi:hypothetical protein